MQNLGTGRGNSCLILGNSGNFHHRDNSSDRESESTRRVLTGKCFLLKNKTKKKTTTVKFAWLIVI